MVSRIISIAFSAGVIAYGVGLSFNPNAGMGAPISILMGLAFLTWASWPFLRWGIAKSKREKYNRQLRALGLIPDFATDPQAAWHLRRHLRHEFGIHAAMYFKRCNHDIEIRHEVLGFEVEGIGNVGVQFCRQEWSVQFNKDSDWLVMDWQVEPRSAGPTIASFIYSLFPANGSK